jgi:phosphate transport system protein
LDKNLGERKKNMGTHFQKELQELKESLLKMAGLVEGAISDAVQSLVKRDTDLAQETFEGEDKINDMELAIDDSCLKLLALRQPVAADLRFITSAMKIVTDLERMGDQAVNIADVGLDDERLAKFREVRDRIERRIKEWSMDQRWK